MSMKQWITVARCENDEFYPDIRLMLGNSAEEAIKNHKRVCEDFTEYQGRNMQYYCAERKVCPGIAVIVGDDLYIAKDVFFREGWAHISIDIETTIKVGVNSIDYILHSW